MRSEYCEGVEERQGCDPLICVTALISGVGHRRSPQFSDAPVVRSAVLVVSHLDSDDGRRERSVRV